jgi:hypothetical protein
MEYPIELLSAQSEANLRKVHQPLQDLAPERAAYEVANSLRSQVMKFQALQRITQSVSEIVSSVTACSTGCSHCCLQAVDISEIEAKAISKATGRAYTQPKLGETFINQKKYRGVPCNFLKDGRCSIYSERPIICRTYANMSNISEVCNCMASPNHMVPLLDVTSLVPAYAMICTMEVADIRDWFPEQL